MAQGWHEEKVTNKIKETGYTYVFHAENTCFPAFVYPESLGELKHIYQNGLYDFDLIDSFVKTKVKQNNKIYYMYKFPEETFLEDDKFEFLWNDRK